MTSLYTSRLVLYLDDKVRGKFLKLFHVNTMDFTRSSHTRLINYNTVCKEIYIYEICDDGHCFNGHIMYLQDG